jgi:hypothetical protein
MVAGAGLLTGGTFGAAWALVTRWSDLPAEWAPGLGLGLGALLALSLDPLTGLRAGPLRELADDWMAVLLWLCARALALVAAVLSVVVALALAMEWRADSAFAMALASAVAGVVGASAFRLYAPRPVFRAPAFRASPAHLAPRFGSRAARLGWIDLARRQSALPVGVWAGLCWIAALLVGMAETEPRLIPVIGASAAGLAFLGTALALRFDAATARLLTFEPGSLSRLAMDMVGRRLIVVALVAALVALLSTPAVLAGAALGAGLRALEFLHGVCRSAASARLLAQVETALVLGVAVVAGPAALVWLVVRTAWLYRRAGRSMGLA